jgi:MraZ protein
MTKGLDGCIYVYPDDEWKKFVDKLNVMPMASRNVRQFKRYLLSCAYPCDMDGQGRTLIPQPLREHAGIEKEAMVVGVGEKLEIWNKETYKKIVDEENLDMDDIADAINEMNLNI